MPDEKAFKIALDGQELKRLVRSGLAWLQHHQEAINTLNVFPVPDGDTGTNMVLTMQSAWDEVKDSPEREVGLIAHKVAHGALMGARGNSGVILSQIWRGLARELDGKAILTGDDLARAMEEGAQTAYKGVIRPVEGTILTVAREAAEEATHAADRSEDLVYIMEQIVEQAQETLSHTPELLPVLAEAGVVDAGGQGLCVILEGMLRHLRGETVSMDMQFAQAVDLSSEAHPHGEAGYGYDVQFTLVGEGLDTDAILAEIDDMGDCALVAGDPTTVRIHVHVPDPGVPLSYGVQLGSLRDVVVEDMQAQYQDFVMGREPQPLPSSPASTMEIGVVAVAAGEGLARVFRSLGAAHVIEGGQTMNPSTQEILEATESVPNEKIIILPNNKNIIMAAEQARDLSDKQAMVVPTRTIPQGIAAILALNYQADLEDNAEAMLDAAQEVHTGEVTTATRDAVIGGVSVHEGDTIGLHDGELVVAGETPAEVTHKLLERLDLSDLEIVTLYYGADVTLDEAQGLLEELQEAYPELEFELIEGGQPHYFYLISAE